MLIIIYTSHILDNIQPIIFYFFHKKLFRTKKSLNNTLTRKKKKKISTFVYESQKLHTMSIKKVNKESGNFM